MKTLNLEDLPDFINYISQNDIIDLSSYEFINPVFYAIIWAKVLKNNIKIIEPKNIKSFQYLKKIGGNDTTDTTLPIKRFNPLTRDAVDIFSEEFVNILQISNINQKLFVKYTIQELINNTVDHAQSKTDVVCCAQLFPNLNNVEIVVVDTGIGFLSTISSRYSNIKNNIDAIKKALEKGTSGSKEIVMNGILKNAGFGLFAIHSMIKKFGVKFSIISYDGFLKQNKSKIDTQKLEHYWEGSIIVVKLPFNIQETLNLFLRELDQSKTEAEDIF